MCTVSDFLYGVVLLNGCDNGVARGSLVLRLHHHAERKYE